MNYIKQLNAFYKWLKSNKLSPTAIAVYFAILMSNNENGWNEWFGKSNQDYCKLLGIDEKTFVRARNELREKGLIDFIPGYQKGKYTMYHIVQLYTETENYLTNICLDGEISPNNCSDGNIPPKVSNLDGKTPPNNCSGGKIPSQTSILGGKIPPKEVTENCINADLQVVKNNNCLNNIVDSVVNNVCSYTTTNKVEQSENRKEMIVELTKRYREATKSNSEDDYKYIGRLLKEYDAHLIAKACDELELVLLERKIDNPRGYLRGILKNLQSPPSSQANNTDNTACAPVNTNTGGERQSEAKIIDWSEDFLRRAKNDKYAQFYEWG
uniref:Helix-turn-helix domain-containing protein n=1 Tax=Caldicellulosiruptor owensensis TaxID=55205 RepID=A0A7C5Z7H2_9FIRM